MALLLRNKLQCATAARPVAASRRVAVVRAQAQPEQRPALVQLAQNAVPVAVVSNLLMAMPAAAEAGKLFDFNATLPVVSYKLMSWWSSWSSRSSTANTRPLLLGA
jgi:F-type H+-transporting ATPase subunit b